MDNHVHILIKEGIEEIGKSIKRITVGYVQFHNTKYRRTGHLLQNRYKSEKVEDDSYFLTVLRYIHQNPLKAGLVSNLDNYEWSSYKYYASTTKNKFVTVKKAKEYFKNQSGLLEFMNMDNKDQCLEYEVKTKYFDEELKSKILKRYETELSKELSKTERDNLIREIKELTGVSNRELCRALGIGRGIVERATLKRSK